MSEYQYYEFQAIDRPLSDEEMEKLRCYSTRARISRTSFVNEYHWGDFKGDPEAWMEKYFDAFLYFANWRTHILKLRLPSKLLDPETAQQYCVGDSAFVRQKAGRVILSFVSDDEGGEWDDEEEPSSALFAVRAELARGDLRALYLGWLLCVQNREVDDEELEPPVPRGLGELSATAEALAEFLRIDRDLLDVAAQSSPQLRKAEYHPKEVTEWVARLPAREKDEVIASLIVNGDHSAVSAILLRFIRERSSGALMDQPPRRTVGALLQSAKACFEERSRLEADKRAIEKARREHEAALAREQHLDNLRGQESKLWARVESLISTKQPKDECALAKVIEHPQLFGHGEGSKLSSQGAFALQNSCQVIIHGSHKGKANSNIQIPNKKPNSK
ncbi:MAG: hypothetical protein LAO21_02805 [Acidobacteriia bacterium]|nr:hypothetical protein [Terriglobia bacterium]